MRLLLDTHALIWFLHTPHVLPPAVLKAIEEAGENVWVSMASLWEIAIKVSILKLAIPKPFEELFPDSLTDSGLFLLPIELKHLNILGGLPHYHRDPFDRLLIAQAMAENLTIVTCDQAFAAYGVPILW